MQKIENKHISKPQRGMMIVLIGVDGSGKTTVKNTLVEALCNTFTSIRTFYFRPEFLPFLGVLLGVREDVRTGTNPNPHNHKREIPLKSFVRFFYYVIDFILGHWIKVRPCILKGELVIFDRYYYDYLVDPFRFNMSVPGWLPRLLLPIIPAPDLVIYLHASPETLYNRKHELPMSELDRQQHEFNKLLNIIPNSFKISVEQSVCEVTDEIVAIIQGVRNRDE